MTVELRRYADTTALDQALAGMVAETLRAGIAQRGKASLVLSGGRTPHGLFTRLATTDLEWDRVWITLADDRWVTPDHADSNERTVRSVLLQGNAAAARFIPLYNGATDPWAGLEAARTALAEMPRPFDVVVLGMGEDGHTASLFPAAATLPPPADAACAECIGVRPAKAPHDRVSLTPAALLDSRLIALHFTGAAKWLVLCDALKPGPADAAPVRAVIHQDRVPCHVYWTL